MAMSFLTRAARATVEVLARDKVSCHICHKALHHGRRGKELRMGVTTSCRRGGASDTEGEAPLQQGRKMSTGSVSGVGEEMEVIICREEDLPQEGMKSYEVEGGKVLVVHHKGQLSAIGAKCSHYGAPLEKGTLCEGRVRCPWHGACFSVTTGDIEDFPGLDSVPKYDIQLADGQVKVRASKALLASEKRIKQMARRDPENSSAFVVVGGGAAGASCVERLRQDNFTGRLVLITKEPHLPYDRPKLSKAMHLTPDKITLRSDQFYEDGDIEVLLGVSASEVNTDEKLVHLSTGEKVPYDKLFIATGGKPRRLGVPGGELPGVYIVRTPEDSNGVVAAAAGKNVVVVGTSFIGMEAAAYLATENRAASVSVIGKTSVPFEQSLGSDVGKRIQRLFQEHQVKFYNNDNVTEFAEEEGKLSGVKLGSGETVAADVVVLGVGVMPNTDFLASSKITRDDRGFVPVNKFLETSIPGVYCGGDVASFPLMLEDGNRATIGHWQVALGHGRTAALNMLGNPSPLASVPFFWTVLFGKSLRYTGYGMYDDVIIGGDLESLSFIAYYCRGERVVAVASWGKDPAAANYAELLQQGKFLTKEEVAVDGDAALKLKC